VLVVEDADDTRFFLKALLTERYEVMAAAPGEAGLQMAGSDKRPDIISLDVMMPDMDGYEVLDRLGRCRVISRHRCPVAFRRLAPGGHPDAAQKTDGVLFRYQELHRIDGAMAA
jgi:response regulator RpfG family c-di-GMP phosphodiesterase